VNVSSDTVRISALVALAVAGSASASNSGPQIKRPIGVKGNLLAAVSPAPAAAPAGVPAAVWSLKGNRGTNPTTDFLGTTDAVDLIFRTNNIDRLRILSTGEVRILSDLTVDRDLRVGRDASSAATSASPATWGLLAWGDSATRRNRPPPGRALSL
jgi:hypothetical protein